MNNITIIYHKVCNIVLLIYWSKKSCNFLSSVAIWGLLLSRFRCTFLPVFLDTCSFAATFDPLSGLMPMNFLQTDRHFSNLNCIH